MSCTHYQWTSHLMPDGTLLRMCLNCGKQAYNLKPFEEDSMARQQKKEVTVTRKPNVAGAYKNQWYVSGSTAMPYTVSEAKDGNWSCSCMDWTRTHPREDCKHVLRVKMAEAVPAEIKVEPKMQFVQATGRMFRDA